jgi:hypothetical protein
MSVAFSRFVGTDAISHVSLRPELYHAQIWCPANHPARTAVVPKIRTNRRSVAFRTTGAGMGYIGVFIAQHH